MRPILHANRKTAVSRIDDALRDGALTWKAGSDEEWELHGDGDVLGRLQDELVTLDGRRLELRHGRGYTTLVDAGLGSRLGSLRIMAHGAGHVTLASTRARITKRGVGPFKWEVTDDLSGPQLLDLTTFAGRLRIKPGSALAEHDVPVGVLVVFCALVVLEPLRSRAVADSPAA